MSMLKIEYQLLSHSTRRDHYLNDFKFTEPENASTEVLAFLTR